MEKLPVNLRKDRFYSHFPIAMNTKASGLWCF